MDSVITQERIEPDMMVLEPVGRLMAQQADEFRRQVNDLVDKKETKLILDLSGLEVIDGMGFAALVLCVTKFKQSGARVVGIGLHGQVLEFIKLVHMPGLLLESYSSLEEAAASLNK